MDTKGLLDIILLPKQVYQKLTDKKAFLYGGIICVGVADIAFPLFEQKVIFSGKSAGMLNYNIGIAVLFALLLGFVDVMFFSLPIFDFLRILKKDGPLFTNINLIRLAKTYIIANLIAIPFNILLYWIMYTDQTSKALPEAVIITAVMLYFFLMPAWFSALITRGANVIFDIEELKRPLVFAVIFTWNYLLAKFAFSYIIQHWVMWFFK